MGSCKAGSRTRAASHCPFPRAESQTQVPGPGYRVYACDTEASGNRSQCKQSTSSVTAPPDSTLATAPAPAQTHLPCPGPLYWPAHNSGAVQGLSSGPCVGGLHREDLPLAHAFLQLSSSSRGTESSDVSAWIHILLWVWRVLEFSAPGLCCSPHPPTRHIAAPHRHSPRRGLGGG